MSFRKKLIIGASTVFGLGVVAFLIALFQPFKSDGNQKVSVKIPPGSGIKQIGSHLATNGVVDSSTLFAIRATLSKQNDRIRSGRYTFAKNSSYSSALTVLNKGPVQPKIVTITIPEGMPRSQISERSTQLGINGDYLNASKKVDYFDPKDYGASGSVRTLEGFLFPSTYELKGTQSVDRLVRLQLNEFKEEFAKLDLSFAKKRNISPYELLIIASMIEREVSAPEERRLVSAVIYNRLKTGMHLGIDATTRYALDNWTKPLTNAQLAIKSPYNTRKYPGLPPTPIGNPGLDSLKAAANPANVKYLYYVAKPGTCDRHSFSTTNEKFQRDVHIYQQERGKLGGKSPTKCH